ncbi:cytochrome c oxidase subunit II [Robertkochia marina]|uniref:Cytochrome c oxidase subunit 2 n=1 Tax=Robertkochia marina TaxID=1227945 RepID=A0A4S3M1M6_9FLAO|nr:cytochrome c oxidase subunit II [Robertkochia marina]THD69004.1 cytochrome c oxidase subunit II [Robertkochia marina]TRZ44827.1 cytochrome c oxidase subunit II [Robertkochia marina]
MTALLIIIVLVLVAIAIWQMTKIFELSQVKSEKSEVANDQDNKLNGYLMFGFLVFIYLLTIFSFWKWGDKVLGTPASAHGSEYDNLMFISFALIFFVQIITQALLHYFAFKYRGEKGKKALFYADNDKLEFIWTIIPVITLAGLILYGLYTWTNLMDIDEEEGDPIIIELYAQQFNWKARYAGEDNVLGGANVRLIEIDKNNVLGVDESDPYAKDDIISQTELHLPVGRKVIFKMRSQDVLHSAYMPHFRAQMNCVPGMITQFSFTPTITTQEMRADKGIQDKVQNINKLRADRRANGEDVDSWEFDYVLLCNKICGSSHYNMQMKIVVEEEEEFNAWLEAQQTFGEQMAAAQ